MEAMILTFVVLVLALLSFVLEWLPTDLTALSVAVVLMVLGLVTPEEGLAGFSSSATITVMAMFVLSAGIAKTGVIQTLRGFFVRWGGKNLSRQILLMGAIVGPISGFINNTAVVALFIPLVEDWCQQQKISVSKLLMPLSYISVLGGMLTLLGTSTNILASGVAAELGYGPFNLFAFSQVGVILFVVCVLFLAAIAPKLLPNRRGVENRLMGEGYDLEDYVTEVILTTRSSLIGQTLRSSALQRSFDVAVLEIIRNDVNFPQPLADKVLMAGDILLVRGSRAELLRIKEEKGLELFPELKFRQAKLEAELNQGEEAIGEVIILSNARLVGTTIKDLRFRQRYNATVLAIRRGEEILRERLGKVSLKFGDVLLVQGPKESFLGLQTTRELLVVQQQADMVLRTEKAGAAIAIGLGVIGLSAFNLMPIAIAALLGVILMVITRCLKPGEIYGAVRWDVVFLLAGLIPLGTAMEKSGATELLARQFVAMSSEVSNYGLLLFFFLITALLTEFLSNNASVLLMVPIAIKVAETVGINPYAVIFTVMFAASSSFMTPIGYQTNTMVYGAGGYRFTDFFRLGAPLSLLMLLLVPLLVSIFFPL